MDSERRIERTRPSSRRHGMGPGRTLLAIWVAAGLVVAATPSATSAQTDSDRAARCASWIAKKGYSRDYIEQRTGFRPPPRETWQDNIRRDELQVGDVVVVTLWPGHVELIEELARDKDGKPERLRVSSFNYGPGQAWIDRGCNATMKFGVETTHWIALRETVGYWRPEAPGK